MAYQLKHFPRRFLWLGISFISLIFLFSGCAGSGAAQFGSSRTEPVTPFLESVEVWPDAYRSNFEKLESFYGKARLSVESENFSGNVSLQTHWVSPEKLFLQVEGPLGIDVGKVFVGPSRFIWYNQYENHFLSGSVADPYLNRFMQTTITFSDMKYAVLGYAGNWETPLTLQDGLHGIFTTTVDDIEYRYVVTPETGLLEKVEARRDGRTFIEQKFDRYRIVEGVYLPLTVQVTMVDQKERITVFYEKVVVNQPIDAQQLTIQVSSKVEQLNVNE